MRTTTLVTLLGAAALAAVAGCVKDVDQPALAGPSTFAHSIIMVADRDTLTQNGSDFTDIRITSLSAYGESENIPLRAQIYVDGVANDFGLLSSKSAALESVNELRRRIDEASRYVPLERLAISPQCGFASSVGGNPLTIDDQRRKLARVVEVAELVWR